MRWAKPFVVALLALLCCFCVSLPALCAQAASSAPRLTADSAILIDWQTGTVLYDKKAHAFRHPASLTKVMTAIVALENSLLQDVVTVTREACYLAGSSMNLRPGQKFTMDDLLYCMLMKSANDAASAVAIHVGGSIDGFAAMMNEKAREIGALNTHFRNPHGHTEPGHLTTAFDMALIARYAMSIPYFAETVSTKEADVDRLDKHIVIRLRNTNRLLWHFEGADGVKTGTTAAAGKSLIASATREEQRLIAVVLHSDSRWADAEALLNHGFAEYSLVSVYRKGEVVRTVRVTSGMSSRVPLVAMTDLALVVKKSDKQKVTISDVVWSIKAPCDPGKEVARVSILIDGQEAASTGLSPLRDVRRRTIWRVLYQNTVLPLIRPLLRGSALILGG